MKQYDSVAGVKPPFVKATDVQEAFDRILYECLYLDNATMHRIESIIRNEGFLANTKQFDKMVKDNG